MLSERKLKLDDTDRLLLLGTNDEHLRLIERRFQTSIVVRGEDLILRGDSDEVKTIERIFDELKFVLRRTGELSSYDVESVLELVLGEDGERHIPTSGELVYSGNKIQIRARTPNQKQYVDLARKSDITFAIGPAGTGKTYLAVALAVAALRNGDVSRLVLSRPAVEAGESLGFLPGDMQEKVDPYLRPIFDALLEMMGGEKLKILMEKRIVEIIPLAFMRGRTFNNAFVILDEAQNTTTVQMKMFLTRIGRGSKAIVTGDITQTDLPRHKESGLRHVREVLQHVDGISFMYFDKRDVVRHKLVAEIIHAYEQAEKDSSDV